MPRLTASFATALCLALALSACSDDGGGDEAADAPAPVTVDRPDDADEGIDWEDCGGGNDCGSLEVPLDYGDPGETIDIALARRRAAGDDDDWGGVLLVNFGGPGATGVDIAYDAEYIFPRELLERFDIVGFDPRGIGESAPVDCGESFSEPVPLDWMPDNDEERETIVASAREFGRACVARNGDLLPHINTANTARDLERIREALGVEQISYIGKSYGTILGAVYADMYPERVRAFVLDAAADTSIDFETYHEEQAASFEATLGAFLDWCAEQRSCDLHSQSATAAAYDSLILQLENETIDAPLYEDEEAALTQADAHSGTLSALYSRGAWAQLGLALVEAKEDGDGSLLLDLAFGGYDGTSEFNGANSAIFCADHDAPRDPQAYHDMSERLQRDAPRLGAIVAYWYLICAYLPAPVEPLAGPYDAEGAAPILVVGTTGDPATPLAWSERLAEQLDSGHLLTRDGYDHTAAFSAVSTCVDDAALRYLVDLELPDQDCSD